MIYIKENNKYFKYHLSDDNKFVCTAPDKTEYVILHDISGEFDGIVTPDEKIHLVLQSLTGELVYLKKENGTWKKFSILKTRKGIRKISNIRLAASGNTLCVFYIIDHQGKKLLIKHCFSDANMFFEPEVVGIMGNRAEYSLLQNGTGKTFVIFKNSDGIYVKVIFDDKLRLVETEKINLESEILTLSAVLKDEEIYFVYAVNRKNSIALAYCSESQTDNIKIVTFGIAGNSSPQILFKGDLMIIQWEEGGAFMQSESRDRGKSFSKPAHLTGKCHFAGVRQVQNKEDFLCDICAFYNMEPVIYPQIRHKSVNKEGADKSMSYSIYHNKPINAEVTNEQILKRLSEIQSSIDKMGKNLISACAFLDDMKKLRTENEELKTSPFITQTNSKLTGEDIGQIDEENIKLFESTDIDKVLPDKTSDAEAIL